MGKVLPGSSSGKGRGRPPHQKVMHCQDSAKNDSFFRNRLADSHTEWLERNLLSSRLHVGNFEAEPRERFPLRRKEGHEDDYEVVDGFVPRRDHYAIPRRD